MNLNFVSNIDGGISKNIIDFGFGVKIYSYDQINEATKDPNETIIFDDGSLSIETLKEASNKSLVYTTNFSRSRGLGVPWMGHWADMDLLNNKKSITCGHSRQYDCFCYKMDNPKLIKELKKNFNTFVSDKDLTNEDKSFLFRNSRVFCNFDSGDLVSRSIFEAGACGGTVVTNQISSRLEMESVFESGVHICTYESIEDCIKKIKICLIDDNFRKSAGKQICRLINKYHSSKKRAKQLIRTVKQFGSKYHLSEI
jgi:hypothetical protein